MREPRPEPRLSLSLSSLVLLLVIAVPALFAWGWTAQTHERPETSHTNRPNQQAQDGYVGSQACRACHPAQYATWHASYHRTMTGVATRDTVAGNFEVERVTEVPGRAMRLERRGRELWAEFDDPDWDGRGSEPPRVTRQVVMTTGSHYQQIYWYATGHDRLLGQLPAIQLIADGRWIPRRSATMHPPGVTPVSETGSWNAVCVQCHTTAGRPEFSTPFGADPILSQAVDTKAAEFGIACEMCHGPGDAHVRANANPVRRYTLHFTGRPDPTVVQPLRLASRLSSEVCGQCHSLWEFYDASAERQANAGGLPYRPGDELSKTRLVVQPTRNINSEAMKALLADDPRYVSDIFWSDGMVRATGREYNGLIESPCYKNAADDRRTLSCASCHTMHEAADDARAVGTWADGQVKPAAEGNGACVECHPSVGRDIASHTKHGAASSGSVCYNCHMPFTTYGLLKTIRSHQISSPTVQATLQTGRPNACNLCHLDKTLAWSAERLQQWYGTPAPQLAPDDREIAASLVTLLEGDAGQRAIIAQAMGWPPAQQASGTNWMPPYLALALNDPYDAVRYVTGRTLRSIPGYEEFSYDFVAPPDARARMQRQALERWRELRTTQGLRTDPELLVKTDGTFVAQKVDALLAARNNRRVYYRE